MFAAILRASSRKQRGLLLATREKWQGQNRLPGLIFYHHHQGEIILVATLFSQLPDCVFSIRKRRRYIRQVRAIRIILDPIPSVYREEISRHNALSCRVVKNRPQRGWRWGQLELSGRKYTP